MRSLRLKHLSGAGRGKALNRARSQVYLPAESREHPGFQYRMKTQEGAVSIAALGAARHVGYGGVFVHQRCQAPSNPSGRFGKKYCGLVILFECRENRTVAIMPDA